MMREAVHLVAEQQKMDTAQIWLGRLEWDGVPRVETFCPKYFGTFDREYERAAGRYLWTALVGRIMAPGCQADMVPVLVGRQGVGKSRGVQALVPVADFFTEVRLDEADDVIARKLRGVIVGEMAEMRGLRGSEIERVKAFITRTHEKWIPKYKEFATHYPRRFLLIGTTNDEEFLPADSEHRRWLPLHTSQVDVAAIKRDREQLWAEALEIWMADGIHWQGMDELAADARKNAAGSDSWIEEISVWLGDNPVAYVRLHDVMANAIGLDIRHTNRSHELRVGRALRELGYERTTMKHNGRAIKAWVFDPTS
jgi:predicted P-loop ATPase